MHLSVECLGQQQVQFSQYFANYLYHNPAFAGRNFQTDAALIHRQQWVGLDGAPKSTLVGVDTRLPKYNLGFGVNFIHDEIGNFSTSGIRLAISSEKRLGLNSLRVGIAPAFYSQSLNAGFSAIDGVDGDPSLDNGRTNSSSFDANLGFSYHTPDYFVGLSVLNLFGSRLDNIKSLNRRTALILLGYEFKNLGVKNLTLQPNMLIKTDLQNLSGFTAEINSLFTFKESVIFGLGYRTFDALFPVLGYQWFNALGKFRVSYSYDYTTSAINSVSRGSHEISLNYSYFIERPTVIDQYKDVRFL